MLRLAPAVGWFLAAVAPVAPIASTLGVLGVLGMPGMLGMLGMLPMACSGPDAPAPSRLADTKNLVQPAVPTRSEAPPGPSPFTNPNKEPPPPRSEPQLPPGELAVALERAEAARKVNDDLETSLALRPCANKLPQSVRCEGELAVALVKMPRHRYEAEYFLTQAIAGDDPTLTAEYYRRLGDALSHKGMYTEAITAYERMITRIAKPSGADYNQLAVALQGVPTRVAEAADALGKAYALEPTRHEWLRDQAILLGQMPDKIAQSIALFEKFKTRTTAPELLADTDRRLGELQAQLAAPPAPAKAPAPARKPKRPAR